MSTIAFLNIAMHGRVNPTLPVVAELVRRGHTVTYHTSPAFREEIEAAGATVYLYPGGDQPLPDPPTPVTLMEGLARTAVARAARRARRPAPRPARPDRPRHRLSVGRGRRPRARGAGGVVVHHVRVQPAGAQPDPRLVGPAGRGGEPARQRSGATCGRAGRCAAASTRAGCHCSTWATSASRSTWSTPRGRSSPPPRTSTSPTGSSARASAPARPTRRSRPTGCGTRCCTPRSARCSTPTPQLLRSFATATRPAGRHA